MMDAELRLSAARLALCAVVLLVLDTNLLAQEDAKVELLEDAERLNQQVAELYEQPKTGSPRPPRGGKGALVAGNPDFGSEPAADAPVPELAQVPRSVTTEQTRAGLKDIMLPPLPQAEAETQQIATALEKAGIEADVLTGRQATEAALKSVHAPRCLHLATHGFFLPSVEPQQTGSAQAASRGAFMPLRGAELLTPDGPTGDASMPYLPTNSTHRLVLPSPRPSARPWQSSALRAGSTPGTGGRSSSAPRRGTERECGRRGQPASTPAFQQGAR